MIPRPIDTNYFGRTHQNEKKLTMETDKYIFFTSYTAIMGVVKESTGLQGTYLSGRYAMSSNC